MKIKLKWVKLTKTGAGSKPYQVTYGFESGSHLIWKTFTLKRHAIPYAQEVAESHGVPLIIYLKSKKLEEINYAE